MKGDKALKELRCCRNNLSGDAVDQLIEELPDYGDYDITPAVTPGEVLFIKPGNDEHNAITDMQLKKARSKGWTFYGWGVNGWEYLLKDDIPGDVNLDGAVDVADIATIITVMAEGTYSSVADVAGDGVIDVGDIAAVISIMAGEW